MEELLNDLAGLLDQCGLSAYNAMLVVRIGVILVMLVITFLLDKLCRKTIIPAIRRFAENTENKWDDYLFSYDVLNNLCRLISPIIIYSLLPLALPDGAILELLLRFCSAYTIAVFLALLCSVITSIYEMSCAHDKLRHRAMKGFYQMLKLIVICIGTIIIVSTLIGKDPIALLAGLGAGTAILMLIFQDTIKGFVAGIQLTANDMIRPGDWITMPKFGADGDVIEVTLTTVKVRNWDKTIVTVPPYALVNESFQNWRGMFDIGGRRIKRSINIDMNTVRFCTNEEMEEFRQQPWMKGFKETGQEEVNLHIFRHYLEYYLRNHPGVNSKMTLLIRQLQPTADGIPIELYFFSADTSWIKYENLQSEVFDHVLAMIHVFKLKAFQSPTGMDLQKVVKS